MTARSTSRNSQERFAMMAFIAAMLMLGTLGIFVNEARLGSVTIVFFRCVFGAVALSVYCLWKRMFRRANFQVRNVWLAVVSGVLMVVNWVAFFEAIQRVGISVATVVFHVQPFLVLLIGAVIFNERITLDKFGWIGIGFAGLLLATGLHLSGVPLDAGYTTGIACTLVAALVYAGVTLITKAITGMPAPLIALIHCAVGVLLLSFWIAWPTLAVSRVQWSWLIGLGVIHTALVYVLVYGALPKLKNASIAVLTFIYPAAAVGFDFLVYGHTLNLLQVAGLILIVLAGAGVNLNWHWRRIYAWRIE
ncbi:DMT family transporter [Undibacterium arcticum]|uniref:DMT family transporter n=2 Tax=Undibacterium arcticum TaxID=1762892 RepID=A0ABV7EZR5_9BURK